MSKLRDLQNVLDVRAGIDPALLKESNHREIMELKISLEKIGNAIADIKGLPKKSPILMESIQNDLDRRSSVKASKQVKSVREELQEDLSQKQTHQKQKDLDIKESLAAPVIESASDVTTLEKAGYDSDTNELTFCLAEDGSNYTPEDFVTMKIFANKATPIEKKTRPERSLHDWVATITEAWLDKDGKLMIKAVVHDDKIKELLANPISRKSVGILIDEDSLDFVTGA